MTYTEFYKLLEKEIKRCKLTARLRGKYIEIVNGQSACVLGIFRDKDCQIRWPISYSSLGGRIKALGARRASRIRSASDGHTHGPIRRALLKACGLKEVEGS